VNFTNFVNAFWDNTLSGLSLGAVYALIALGYTLVYGVLRLINFANSEVFVVGTFGSLIALKFLGVPAGNTDGYIKSGLPLIGSLALMLVMSVAFSAATATALEFLAYRPLRRRNSPRLVFLISAIGASFAIAEAIGAYGAKKRETYSFGRVWNTRAHVLTVGKTNLDVRHVIVFVGALIMMAGLTAFVNKTRLGRGMRAVAQDAETARILGVNVDQVILVTFVVGGVMAGGAAFLYTLYTESTRFNEGFLLGIKSFTAAVLGGIGNLKGALLGGILLGFIENQGAGLFGGKWKDVIAFAVLVIVLMVRPTGLLGESLGKARA
jgi:branched-chain amino acid transport system permease protein